MCGADKRINVPGNGLVGSSPRVRSRREQTLTEADEPGIISACAEQTISSGSPVWPVRDHLRVCGADRRFRPFAAVRYGSSPRVRSRPSSTRHRSSSAGIISACAEQTTCSAAHCSASRDHLRVCGADSLYSSGCKVSQGSSPRVRSRHAGHAGRPVARGIISACAEQTRSAVPWYYSRTDHLRVCGADTALHKALGPLKDHLRVCGADETSSANLPPHMGSSPRVRSRPEAHA